MLHIFIFSLIKKQLVIIFTFFTHIIKYIEATKVCELDLSYPIIHIYTYILFFCFRWIKSFIEQLSVYTPERKQTRRQSLNRENKTKARNTSLRKQTKTPLKNKRNKTPTQSHKTYNRASRRSTNRTPPTCHSVNKSREQQKTKLWLRFQRTNRGV
jgi:hypothetical protein